MTNERVKVKADGSADRVGIVTPDGTRLVKRNTNYFVLYIPGHTWYSGRMEGRKYAPAEYVVYELDEATEHEDGSMLLKGSTILDIPVRLSKKS